MVQNAINIMEELVALKACPAHITMIEGQGGVNNDMGLGEIGAPSVAGDDDISIEANGVGSADACCNVGNF
jgi:hypothetical protein